MNDTNDKNKSNVTNEPEKTNDNHGSTSSLSASPGFPMNPVDALVDTLVRQNNGIVESSTKQQLTIE